MKIEKNIPIPSKSEFTLALSKLEVGESFFFTGRHASNRLANWKKYNNRPEEFTTRSIDGGTRIWRIK